MPIYVDKSTFDFVQSAYEMSFTDGLSKHVVQLVAQLNLFFPDDIEICQVASSGGICPSSLLFLEMRSVD